KALRHRGRAGVHRVHRRRGLPARAAAARQGTQLRQTIMQGPRQPQSFHVGLPVSHRQRQTERTQLAEESSQLDSLQRPPPPRQRSDKRAVKP
ncbi:hypothetical protein JYU34_021916, partial [Plutella xylostella]